MLNGQWSIAILVNSEPIHNSPLTIHYSVRSDFTGLAIAAFNALRPTVANATNKANAPAMTNTHQYIFVRYAKSFNQLFIIHQATGIARTDAINTSLTKTFDNIVTSPVTEAPTTSRMTISLIHCSDA